MGETAKLTNNGCVTFQKCEIAFYSSVPLRGSRCKQLFRESDDSLLTVQIFSMVVGMKNHELSWYRKFWQGT